MGTHYSLVAWVMVGLLALSLAGLAALRLWTRPVPVETSWSEAESQAWANRYQGRLEPGVQLPTGQRDIFYREEPFPIIDPPRSLVIELSLFDMVRLEYEKATYFRGTPEELIELFGYNSAVGEKVLLNPALVLEKDIADEQRDSD